jgi:hypothetical protein
MVKLHIFGNNSKTILALIVFEIEKEKYENFKNLMKKRAVTPR